MKGSRRIRLRWIAMALTILVLVLWFGTAVRQLKQGHNQEDRLLLEKALRRAAVTCYAVEGAYPPNLSYLTEHYGIVIDWDRYTVFYEVFAENLIPEITVVEMSK